MLLDVDLLLELHAVAHFHELVGIAGITVPASELAAAVRIDGPGEGHGAPAVAAVQQRLRRKREVFDIVSLAKRFSLRGETGDAHEAGLIEGWEQRKGRHGKFAFCSPMICSRR